MFFLFRHNSRKHKIGPLRKARNKPGISVLNRRLHFPPELLLHIGNSFSWNIPMPRNTASLFVRYSSLPFARFEPVYIQKIKDLISYVKEYTGQYIVFQRGIRYRIMREGRVVPVYEEFTQNRIAQLRMQKNVSARDMSLSLGQNNSYINQIENKKALPSLQGLFYICEYFGVTPQQFFDDGNAYPAQIVDLVEDMKKLDAASLEHLAAIVKEMVGNK